MPDKPWGIPDAAAVPVPDAGDDSLREQLISASAQHRLVTPVQCICCWRETDHPGSAWEVHQIDALLPLIREHVAVVVQAERERVSALLASIPDEYYPTDVFGGALSTDESRQANEVLKAEGLPTFDRVGANAMRHAYRNAARLTLEEPDDDD